MNHQLTINWPPIKPSTLIFFIQKVALDFPTFMDSPEGDAQQPPTQQGQRRGQQQAVPDAPRRGIALLSGVLDGGAAGDDNKSGSETG